MERLIQKKSWKEIHYNGNGLSSFDRIMMGNLFFFVFFPACKLELPGDLQKIQISRLHSPEVMNRLGYRCQKLPEELSEAWSF